MNDDNATPQSVNDPALIDSADEVAAGFVGEDLLDGDRQVERLDIEDVVGVDLGKPEAIDGDKPDKEKHE